MYLFLIITFKNFFIFWLWWVFVAACGLYLATVSRGYPPVAVLQASPVAVIFPVAEHRF